jgi:hypothetical protein
MSRWRELHGSFLDGDGHVLLRICCLHKKRRAFLSVQKRMLEEGPMSEEHVFKAFRPSRMSGTEDMDDESRVAKEAKMAQYEVRAQAGLPLFDGPLGMVRHIHKKAR